MFEEQSVLMSTLFKPREKNAALPVVRAFILSYIPPLTGQFPCSVISGPRLALQLSNLVSPRHPHLTDLKSERKIVAPQNQFHVFAERPLALFYSPLGLVLHILICNCDLEGVNL